MLSNPEVKKISPELEVTIQSYIALQTTRQHPLCHCFRDIVIVYIGIVIVYNGVVIIDIAILNIGVINTHS